MKSIIISSNCSGGGKTTFTLGIMKALKDKGLKVQGYKVGPDYIDTAFHKEATGVESRNLDTFLMGKDGVKRSYFKGNGDVGIIEGAMGLYDGVGATTQSSTYDISKNLGNMSIILVLSPKGQSSTLCAEINGLKNYRHANIVGVVLNCISEKYYKLLKYSIEKNCNIKVFGYVPKNEEVKISSRHLGLVQSSEIENLQNKLELCSELISEHINLDGILEVMSEVKCDNSNNKVELNIKNRNLNIAIALDKAFSFYYKDNIELLKSIGNITYFSPINDDKLPDNVDFLYIGGGYPEVFKEELSKNLSMRKSIKEALDSGLRCYAECGGLMYLTEEIDGYEMVGFFNGKSEMTKGLKRFGYCTVNIDEKYLGQEIKINAHEFHKSDVSLNENKIYNIEKTQYDGEKITWECGYLKNNTLAGYAHINFLGNIKLLESLINR
ncbi:cobyrinate a,c-diamide synthase [Clostridium botulinum]|uniref:cobyrinate a,c-diamide synthase n=1 Tax=unclassified Clostridium TaxID=2614128 RepID=UPI0013F0F3CB|nr:MULTISPECIES: cobyrinate a,c-diamide synthase [unclassified Clostridium]MBN1056273.1 cobyrinate a,c-diamide synthase [Clostridium botulinum]NFS28282.1 cobyrinate a,c-diamide synthase [Clostridium botulinum]NFS53422.1 cobyrinate a,c-diamide synthase [Clostridium botulinum]NFT17875.1 cobyrinate a,c-diamide synthase [Clostridium botulinum]